MVAYMKRCDAGYELMRETVRRLRETGRLGELTYVRIHAYGGDPGWAA